MRILYNPCSNRDAATDGISGGLQVTGVMHSDSTWYEASNAEDGVWEMTLCNTCSTQDAATDGISDGLQVI